MFYLSLGITWSLVDTSGHACNRDHHIVTHTGPKCFSFIVLSVVHLNIFYHSSYTSSYWLLCCPIAVNVHYMMASAPNVRSLVLYLLKSPGYCILVFLNYMYIHHWKLMQSDFNRFTAHGLFGLGCFFSQPKNITITDCIFPFLCIPCDHMPTYNLTGVTRFLFYICKQLARTSQNLPGKRIKSYNWV